MPAVQKNPSLNSTFHPAARTVSEQVAPEWVAQVGMVYPSSSGSRTFNPTNPAFPRISNNCMRSYRYGFNGMEKDDEVKGSGNSYDFGARIYDPRVGRWLAVDKVFKKYPNESCYLYAGDSPLLYIDIGGLFKYIIDESAKTKYPHISVQRFENILRNLEDYLLSNPDIIEELHKNTGLPVEDIKKMIKYGEGPVIRIVDNGLVLAGNVTPQSYQAGEILLDVDQVTTLESVIDKVLGYYATNMVSLILHEFTHYGDRKSNKGWITGEDVAGDKKTDEDAQQTSEPGVQDRGKSICGERGMDMESYFIFGAYRSDAQQKVPVSDTDGKLTGESMEEIRNSYRYKKDKEKMIKLTKEPQTK